MFDNVDHYVNTETGKPTAELAPLVEASIHRRHASKLVFTCRPTVQLGAPNALPLNLGPLSERNVDELFDAFRVAVPAEDRQEIVARTYALTGGHPIWTSLLARRFATNVGRAQEILSNLRQSKNTELPETVLHSIWGELRTDEQQLLRALVEIPRPQTQDRLAELCVEFAVNRSRFERRFKKLVAVGLIVERGAQPPEYDLHPLIRAFVHRRFPAEQQRTFRQAIKRVYDTIMGKALVRGTPSKVDNRILDDGFDRIDIALQLGEFATAIVSLATLPRTRRRDLVGLRT